MIVSYKWTAGLSLLLSSLTAAAAPAQLSLVVFDHDPLRTPTTSISEGSVGERLRWELDAPKFNGDAPGSLRALYRSDLPSARLGWSTTTPLTERDAFTLWTIVTIESEDFAADPFGFHQISWGLWNAGTTGLQRTGTPTNFAADTFDLLEWDYFPNVSPFFGGPFVTPTAFGAANRQDPFFDLFGAFTNVSFGSVEYPLPLDQPLLVSLEHDPTTQRLRTQIWLIAADGSLQLAVDATALAAIDALPLAQFDLTRFGLTLWQDGFTGPTPSLQAVVRFEAIGLWLGSLPLEITDIGRLLQ
jgi:hypothetical protein